MSDEWNNIFVWNSIARLESTDTVFRFYQVVDLIGFICIQSSVFSNYSRGGFFSYVAMQGFWFTGIMLGLYLFQVVYKFNRIPWLRIEMWVCAVEAALFLLASCLAAGFGANAFIAAAVSWLKICRFWTLRKFIFFSYNFQVFRFLGYVGLWIWCFLEVQRYNRHYCEPNDHCDNSYSSIRERETLDCCGLHPQTAAIP